MPKPILLLFLFLFLIFTVQANTPNLLFSKHGTVDFFRGGRTLLSTDDHHPVLEQDNNIEKTLVVIDDNTSTLKLILVEALSGKQLWELNIGSPVSSSLATVTDDMIRIDPTSLQSAKSDKKNIMEIMKHYINDLEKRTEDITIVSRMEETRYTVDACSGELIRLLHPKNGLSVKTDTNGIMYPENGVLDIKRTDQTWAIQDRMLPMVLRNITVSTIEIIRKEKDKGPRVNVVHFYSPKAGFIQLLKFKDKTLGFPIGGSEIFMRLLEGGNSVSSTLLLEGGENESLTPPLEGEDNESLMLPLEGGNSGSFTPLPEGGNNESLTHISQGGNKPHTEGGNIIIYMIYLSIVIVLISVVLLLVCLYTRKKMKQKSANVLVDPSGENTGSHKRKKGRKGANTKNGANTQNIGGDNLHYDVEKLNVTFGDNKNRKEQWPSPGMPLGVKANGRMIGKLYISYTEIARGSNGTVVLEGVYDGRLVAVKRLVRAHNDIAHKEVQNLIASDQHPNIVRYHGVEYDSDFVYLALERCSCTLSDLIKNCSESSSQLVSKGGNSLISAKDCSDQLDISKENNRSIQLWKANKYPSPEFLRLMRDVVSGLEHLHELGIIHRDLKPQNILIINGKFSCAKLSDMGISKRLLEDKSSLDCHFTGYGSSGWQAPEQLLQGRQTRAMDLFSLGCVLFFCITGGKHPFGDHLERDINIVKNRVDLFLVHYIPEAVDLFSHVLDPDPELRPTAKSVLHHPLFWNSEIRLSFLRDVSDRVELEGRAADSNILKALENIGQVALGGNWDEKMETKFIDNIGRYRRYKYDSVRDLLRVMRNKLNHYRELPKGIQEILGSVPDGFDAYFANRFPKLLIEVYKVISRYCREEECFRKYFETV